MAIKIYLSPSDQTKNAYAYGGTTEAIQCRRIADATEKALKRCGFEVKNNQKDSMIDRVAESNNWGADLHLPIHTNAYNGKVGGTRMFCYNKTGEGYKACRAIFNVLAPLTIGTSEVISVDATLYEVKRANAPTAYIEVDFHDVPNIAKWIIEHTTEIGEAIAKGVCNYFGKTYKAATPAAKPVSSDAIKLPVLRKGDKGVAVLIMQKLLGMEGDGIFGSVTEKKLKAFQKKHGSNTCDGICGAWTWKQFWKL